VSAPPAAREGLVAAIRRDAVPITGSARDLDAVLDVIGDARLVLIGEGSHGTHEFYRQRALITRRLISERGFNAVAVEADWPDALRVNRYVRGDGQDADAERALAGFERFPAWMWRNADVLDFVGWLRARNDRHPERPAGFYGLDLYSLYRSIAAVIRYVDSVDVAAGRRARRRYACLEQFNASEAYGFAVASGQSEPCRAGAVQALVELQRSATAWLRRDGATARDEQFYAEENARLVLDAEAYYRSMFDGGRRSWNLRDRHMAETLDRLLVHLTQRTPDSRIVAWAHNSHVGDARATEMAVRGEHNLGQLARERHGDDVRLIGFTTHSGTVTAAEDWGAPAGRRRVRPALPGSAEELLHAAEIPAFTLPLRGGSAAAKRLDEPFLERAIGVIYRPETERASHYFHARLARQFDAVIHLDRTRATEPLERTSAWDRGEPPETYPTAL
jgi:erythromycin esterase-like protein